MDLQIYHPSASVFSTTFFGISINVFDLIIAAEANDKIQPTFKLFDLILFHASTQSIDPIHSLKSIYKVPLEVWDLIRNYLIPLTLRDVKAAVNHQLLKDCHWKDNSDFDGEQPERCPAYDADCCSQCRGNIKWFFTDIYTPEQLPVSFVSLSFQLISFLEFYHVQLMKFLPGSLHCKKLINF